MIIDREMISELIGVAFAVGLHEGKVPTIKLISRATLDTQGSNSGISMPQNKYVDKSCMYKGKDGHDYPTTEALFEADRAWMAVNFPKLGPKLGINRWRGVDY